MERLQAKWAYEERVVGRLVFKYNDLVVKIFDKASGELIRTMLSKDFCDFAEELIEKRRKDKNGS